MGIRREIEGPVPLVLRSSAGLVRYAARRKSALTDQGINADVEYDDGNTHGSCLTLDGYVSNPESTASPARGAVERLRWSLFESTEAPPTEMEAAD